MQPESENKIDEPELDSASLDAIRTLMAHQEEPAMAAPPTPRASFAQEAKADDAQVEFTPPEAKLPPRKADGLPDLTAAPPVVPLAHSAGPGGKLKSALDRTKNRALSKVEDAKAKVLGYRPKLKHIAWAGFALLVVMRPWLVVGLLFLFLFIMAGVFLILGYDGFWRRAMALGRWHARRHPERSAELHRRLDQFAVRWDAVLDRLPEGSVDGLYLPDFGDIAEADARHDEALARRLSSLKETEA